MNNDATPTSAAPPTPDEDGPVASPTDEHHSDGGSPAEVEDDAPAPPSRHISRTGLSKKLKFMTQLLRNLDGFVFAELSALYYMECSFLLFCLRSFAQLVFLTPKADTFPLIIPAAKIHVAVIFVPNIVCVLFHLFASLPEASEEFRGYLHGGVMVDFVGQKPPTSKFSLLLFDMVITAFQCLMLAVHAQREKLRSSLRPRSGRRRTRAADGVEAGQENTQDDSSIPVTGTQDHDAEERGVLRDSPDNAADDGDIELQPLMRDSENGQEEEPDRNHSPAPGGVSGRTSTRTRMIDVMNSGNAILGEFHILHTIRTATTDYDTAARHSLQTLGYTAALAAITVRGRAAGAVGAATAPR